MDRGMNVQWGVVEGRWGGWAVSLTFHVLYSNSHQSDSISGHSRLSTPLPRSSCLSAMAKTYSHPFPAPKKGKARMAMRTLVGNNAGARKMPYVPYVRFGTKSAKSRPDRIFNRRRIRDLYTASPRAVVKMLLADGFLQNKEGQLCPFLW